MAGTMPGVVFTGCNYIYGVQAPPRRAAAAGGGAESSQPAARRREVAVKGRRVKTIDVHCHCVISETLALLGFTVEDQRGPGIAEVGARRIREMDEQGI